jgi:hypothetical protein
MPHDPSATPSRMLAGAAGWTFVAIAGLAALFLAPRLLALVAGGDARQPRFAADSVPVAQAIPSRVWKPLPWTLVGTLDAAGGVSSPGHLSAEGDTVWLLDGQTFAVFHIDDAARVMARVPLPDDAVRRTSLPITAFGVDPHGVLWIASPSTSSVGVTPSGAIADVRPGAYKLAFTSTAIVGMEGPMKPYLFSRYDRGTASPAHFGVLLDQQFRYKLALDGEITADPAGGRFFYGSYYGGMLASFDDSGARRFLVRTIDPAPLPRLVPGRGGVVRVERPSHGAPLLSDVAVAGERLFVLMDLPADRGRSSVLDTYDAGTGRYLESAALPRRCDEIAVGSSAMFLRCGKEVTVWKD